MGKKLTDLERDTMEKQLIEYRKSSQLSQHEKNEVKPAEQNKSVQHADTDLNVKNARTDAVKEKSETEPNKKNGHKKPANGVAGQLKRERTAKLIRVIITIAVILLIICIVGCCGWKYYQSQDPHLLDTEALEGALPGKTQGEIEAELNKVVEDGKFNVAMSSLVAIDGDKGIVNIENVPGNKYLMQVDIIYTDPNSARETVIYKSGVIKPGYSIGEATMDSALPHIGDGEMTAYDAMATFHALDPETKREMGSTQLNIVLAYKNK
ncbi:MAG: hypothetical protein RR998_03245 [Oscillospiraceae bacterium]